MALPITLNFPSQWLGPDNAFALTQLARTWLFWTFSIYLIRWTCARHAAFVVVECFLIASQVLWYFVGHQQGFINRPFAFVDPLWARGLDPSPAFLLVGLVVAITVSILLAVGRAQQLELAVDLPTQGSQNFEKPSAPVWRWSNLAAMLAILLAIFLWVPSQKIQEYSEKYGPAGGDEEEVRYGKGESKRGKDSKDKGPKPPNSGGGAPTPTSSPGQGQQGGSPSPSPGAQSTPSSSPSPGNGSQGGASDPINSQNQPQFSDAQKPNQNSPVAVVVFQDDYKPESEVYYFRQVAYSEYNGIKLIKSADERFDRDFPDAFPTRRESENGPGESGGAILPNLNPGAFKTVKTRVALMTQHSRPFGLCNAQSFWACDNPDPSRFQKAFEVRSLALTLPYKQMLNLASVDSVWSPAEISHYLQAPADPRYRKLADQILKDSKFSSDLKSKDFAKAVAIKMWLDENCTYSLQSPHKEAADPVASFLFGDRVGYCVFTSHSAAYLYRSLGIPARIAEGYAVSINNRGAGSSLLIRARDAHSWPEIYLEGLGWMPLDINPKKSLVPPPDQVDPGLQQMLGDMARQENAEDPKDPLEKPRIDLRQLLLALVTQLVWGLPWALGLTAFFLMAMKFYRRIAARASFSYYRRWQSRTGQDSGLLDYEDSQRLSTRAYRGVLDQLADRGLGRRFGQSREDFARTLAQNVPSLMPLTRLHLGCQLNSDRLLFAQLQGQWLEVQREVRSLPKTWRYYLRLLNPVSWWSVH